MTTLADKLRNEPGVDITRLQAGIRLLVETEKAVYEINVLRPQLAIVEIVSSETCVRRPTVGQYVGGHLPPDCDVPAWIGKGLQMVLRFRNVNHTTSPVTALEVKAATWHYNVF